MTRTEALAQFLREHPRQWYDGAGEIARVAGRYGWRSRISDVRLLGMAIVNRQRRVQRSDGTGSFIISEYAYIPENTPRRNQDNRSVILKSAEEVSKKEAKDEETRRGTRGDASPLLF